MVANAAQRGKPKPKPPPPAPTATASAPPSAPTATTPAAPEPTAAKKEEAKQRFERAMALFDKKAWDAALAEFLESRAAYPTRSNTQNAGICLRNLNRFDEALDMFEALLKEFPNLSASDRAAVEKEVAELQQLVGTIEIRTEEKGAQIAVDGRDRGQTPSWPLRVSAGSHTVRVFKEGLQPFEKRVEVAGRQNVVVDAKLEALGQSGRLSVTEDGSKVADVVVDNVVVGKTPWQGLVGVGDHVVFLRGEGNLGTQPAAASVRTNQVTPIVLALEPLECPLKVEPTPNGATVAIDGVVVGAGVWDGRLRKGRHKIEAAQNGFLPQEKSIELAPAKPERIAFALERDPNSPLWRVEKPPRIYAELAPSIPIALVFGGDVSGGGSASIPLGVSGRVHVGYELRSGLGVGLDAGYMYLTRSVSGRDTLLHPVGKPDAPGTADDRITLRGLLVGASAHLHRGEKFPLLLRLGAGVALGSASDRRAGDFTAAAVDNARTATDVSYLYVAPEVRLGWRVVERVEISVGTDVMLMVGLKEARWDAQNSVVLGNQGLASYADESMIGTTLIVIEPGIAARFDF
ncbi:MAG TPA: PEGA domain-containing protein [Labilithrix sp.]